VTTKSAKAVGEAPVKISKQGKLWRSDGRCGKGFNNDMGTPGQCNPEASANQEGPCCSSVNWCGNSDAHCKCDGCVDYSETAITPIEAKMSSVWNGMWHGRRLIGANCIDGNKVDDWSICHTIDDRSEKFPWIAIVIPPSTVSRVKITNRKTMNWIYTKNMKIRVGTEFPSTTDVEYSGGSLLGTFKGPGTKGQIVDIFSKEGLIGTHVIIQMESRYLNLLEIEIFGKPVPYSARCIDTGCKKTGLGEDVEAECVYLKNVNWTSISHIYNVSTPWKEGLCKGADFKEDCCKCLPRLPVGCVDVKHACKDSFGGLGVCKNFVKDDMSAIDFEQGSKKGLCNMDKTDCCECFSLKKTKTTKP